ncbi:hypothetical protein CAEBREN_22967 [Caenorhabditis brenneri]|uniref:Uncharacterized protein n=1 Tax=Caenorhabditis brenneri TaxID=135651 RepID=G0P1T3_CAEBE|nr:hypothetical protein CAEBREN_22967 [Caenorhabditis brenneri]
MVFRSSFQQKIREHLSASFMDDLMRMASKSRCDDIVPDLENLINMFEFCQRTRPISINELEELKSLELEYGNERRALIFYCTQDEDHPRLAVEFLAFWFGDECSAATKKFHNQILIQDDEEPSHLDIEVTSWDIKDQQLQLLKQANEASPKFWNYEFEMEIIKNQTASMKFISMALPIILLFVALCSFFCNFTRTWESVDIEFGVLTLFLGFSILILFHEASDRGIYDK